MTEEVEVAEGTGPAVGPDLALLSGPITPLLRRHLQDAAFYDMQLRKSQQRALEQASDASAPPPLSLDKTQQFEDLLCAHLEGIWVAGPAAWPLALESLQRWRKASEAFAATWALLALGTPATPTRPERADEQQRAAAWQAWSSEMWRQRAHWDTHLPAVARAWRRLVQEPAKWQAAQEGICVGLAQLGSPSAEDAAARQSLSAPDSPVDMIIGSLRRLLSPATAVEEASP
ncbi:hypothetical protein [Pelomonas sp. BJYL3]|uniref:hypothetical protein n=1 Tax=Pelomonas sp. BJYL3 TaxID=2976697 RepID=UPI0022B5A62A|nr:hypothetical protein [Pelomonas sp. BJYL3]